MRHMLRLELNQLTYKESEWIRRAYNKWYGIKITTTYRQMVAQSIRNRLAQESSVMDSALIWVYPDHVQVYLPSRPFRTNKFRPPLMLVD